MKLFKKSTLKRVVYVKVQNSISLHYPNLGGNTHIMEPIKLDSSKSVYELCTAYPEVADILVEVGFKDIKIPGMLATAGRIMTIPKGAKVKRIDMEDIRQAFRKHGYELE